MQGTDRIKGTIANIIEANLKNDCVNTIQFGQDIISDCNLCKYL